MPNGEVTFAWGDGDHAFNVAKLGQALELEDKCGCGVREIYTRLVTDRWHVNDIRETLRLGLIGSGMKPVDALILVKRYVDDRPWQESHQPALVVIMAALVGVEGDNVGKKSTAERTTAQAAPSSDTMAASSAPPSTASARPSASIHAPLTP